jgi:6-phosphofructokinase 1
MVVGYWKNEFSHVPISATVSKGKRMDPRDKLWTGVLSSTGQPREMR